MAWDHPTESVRKEVSITWLPADGAPAQPLVLNDFTTNPRGSTTITGLKDNETYNFTITSKDQDDLVSAASTTSLRTSTCPTLQAPTITSVTPTNTTVTLQWTNPSQLDFSYVTISYMDTATSTSGSAIPNQVGTASSSDSFLVTDLSASTEYAFTLTAVDTRGNRSPTVTRRATTTDTTVSDPKPPRIENFQATEVALDCTKVNLEWDHPEELNRKQVRLTWGPTDDSTPDQTQVLYDFTTHPTTNTHGSATIAELQDNTSYDFSIVSRNTDNEDSTAVSQTVTTNTCPALQALLTLALRQALDP